MSKLLLLLGRTSRGKMIVELFDIENEHKTLGRAAGMDENTLLNEVYRKGINSTEKEEVKILNGWRKSSYGNYIGCDPIKKEIKTKIEESFK